MQEYETAVQQTPERSYRLGVVDSIELTDLRCRRHTWLVDSLLKPGLAILAGSPKIGKSWLVLHLCMCVAKGEPFWGMRTNRGTVLYIALEDSEQRMQDRILRITEEASANLKIAFACSELGSGVAEELHSFVDEYPDARLVVIDTFQKIRMPMGQMSYAVDYAEISHLKRVADELNLCILLVHHTRKMSDSDCMNEISGTNGIAGSADTLMVLKKEKRADRTAALFCTGRDITDRELTLELDRTACLWRVMKDSYAAFPREKLPGELLGLRDFMRGIGSFEGTNTAFSEAYGKYLGAPMSPSSLKRQMSRFRYELEDRGVEFLSYRTKKERLMVAKYNEKKDAFLRRTAAKSAQAPDTPTAVNR